MANRIRSQPKIVVGGFIKSKMERDFVFKYKGSPKEAENFVHRMRVELSRLRNQVKARGGVPKSFKMLVRGIQTDKEDPENQVITLRKTMHKFDPSQELTELLDELDGGSKLNV